ncbi:MAG: hypothetical protein WCK91_03085 [bacterium]
MEDEAKKQPVKDTDGIKTVRTFSSDMAEAVRDNEISVVKVALAEQKKHEKNDMLKSAEGTPAKKILWVSGGILLIVISLGIYYILIRKNTEQSTPVVVQSVDIQAFIPYDQRANIDTTNTISETDISNSIHKEVGNIGKIGGIKNIFINKVVAGKTVQLSSREFITAIGSTMPQALARSLPDSYIIGTYLPRGLGSSPHLFLMFQTKDYNVAYASMLSWESTLLNDVFTMFGIDVSGEKKELFDEQWKDVILNNKDARVLYDKSGAPILYYLFLNRDYFIISDSQDAIKEVNSRLINKNIKPL